MYWPPSEFRNKLYKVFVIVSNFIKHFPKNLYLLPYSKYKTKYSTPKRLPIPLPIPSTEEPKELEPTKSYNVYSKKDATKKIRWLKVGSNLPLNEALGIGATSVDQTVSRTFRIEPSNKPQKSTGQYSTAWSDLSYKFRRPKSQKTGHYVEKTTYAIDSKGEHEGITVKGWLASRQKRKLQSFNIKPLSKPQTPTRPVSVRLNTKPISPSYKPFKMETLKL